MSVCYLRGPIVVLASLAAIGQTHFYVTQSLLGAIPPRSQPYLPASAPVPLRYRPPPMVVSAPPPPPPASVSVPTFDTAIEPIAGASLMKTERPADLGETSSDQPVTPEVRPIATDTAAPPGDSALPKGVELLPDARSRPELKLEDIMPFFLPPGTPASRATYRNP